MKTVKAIFISGIIQASVFGQKANSYTQSEVDSIVKTIRTHATITTKKLSEKLCQPFTTEEEKIRAISFWIMDNISYDYKQSKSNNEYRIYQKKGESEEDAIYRIKLGEARKTIMRGKGVCEDYAWLFHILCQEAGITSTVVIGHAVDPGKQLSGLTRKLYSNHAWNGVLLNGQWMLLDLTWASGYVDKKTGVFTKSYNSFYYFPPPDLLIKTHFPTNPDWQLLEKPINTKQFILSTKK